MKILLILLVAVIATITSKPILNQNNTTFGNNTYYYKNWCGKETLKYLDDKDCAKKFPSSFNRDWNCKTLYSNNKHNIDILNNGYVSDEYIATIDNINDIKVNSTAFTSLHIPFADTVHISLILIRRLENGSIFYKFFGNENHIEKEAVETWSSSKIFTIPNAAGTLRNNCSFGIDSTTTGKHGTTPLGDLATIICSYDTTQGYTSNSLAKYFATVGGKERLLQLIQNWLRQTNQSLGGSYGENIPADLGFTFTEYDKLLTKQFNTTATPFQSLASCPINPDFTTPYHPNTLSAFVASELTRRLVMFRDIAANTRFPNTTWVDVQNELYGSSQSLLFPGLQWGGMTADTAIFVQSGTNINEIEEQSKGQWRIFSKLGAGYSSSRLVGEILNNAYACFPVVGADGNGVVDGDGSVEFVISARSSVPHDTSLTIAQLQIQQAIANVVHNVISGNIV